MRVDLDEVDFKKGNGLIPAVAQDEKTGRVLMLAYMNEEALKKTLETGYAHYWSRSRGKLWMKGESSGHIQEVRGIKLDCDLDAVLLQVIQVGVPCHLGKETCFHNDIRRPRRRVE
ncbi:MAG: phosphoribosyl-AMP cyclohydrolase [Candidatus Geothermarchaeales archaeon]